MCGRRRSRDELDRRRIRDPDLRRIRDPDLRRSRDPDLRQARDPDLRASQAERDRVVDSLRRHAGEGRLEVDELEERVERALKARTRGELVALKADLPRERRGRRSSGRAGLPRATGLVALVAGLAVLVLAPPAVAWIGWVAVGWWLFAGLPLAGLGLASCGHSRRRRGRSAATV